MGWIRTDLFCGQTSKDPMNNDFMYNTWVAVVSTYVACALCSSACCPFRLCVWLVYDWPTLSAFRMWSGGISSYLAGTRLRWFIALWGQHSRCSPISWSDYDVRVHCVSSCLYWVFYVDLLFDLVDWIFYRKLQPNRLHPTRLAVGAY